METKNNRALACIITEYQLSTSKKAPLTNEKWSENVPKHSVRNYYAQHLWERATLYYTDGTIANRKERYIGNIDPSKFGKIAFYVYDIGTKIIKYNRRKK